MPDVDLKHIRVTTQRVEDGYRAIDANWKRLVADAQGCPPPYDAG